MWIITTIKPSITRTVKRKRYSAKEKIPLHNLIENSKSLRRGSSSIPETSVYLMQETNNYSATKGRDIHGGAIVNTMVSAPTRSNSGRKRDKGSPTPWGLRTHCGETKESWRVVPGTRSYWPADEEVLLHADRREKEKERLAGTFLRYSLRGARGRSVKNGSVERARIICIYESLALGPRSIKLAGNLYRFMDFIYIRVITGIALYI